MAILLETILKREKEVFDMYIANDGRETSLQPLIAAYSKEDLQNGQIYPFVKVFEYLKLYVSSNNITPEELEKFNQVSEVKYDKKVSRGKQIVELLIENGNRWKEVAILAKKFAQEDGRFRSYTSEELKEWRRLFLQQNEDKQLERTYFTVVELSRKRRHNGYDLDLLNKLVEYKTIEEAANFIKSISISRTSMNSLLDSYKIVYPTKTDEIEFIKNTIEEAYKEEKNTNKFVSSKIDSRKEKKLINFKNLIEEYLISDLEKIDSLLPKHEYTAYGFEEMYKDMEGNIDPIIRMLIDQYDAKQIAIGQVRKEEVEKILFGIVSGVTYGNSYKKLNYYDIKAITDLSLDDILKVASKYFTQREYEMIKEFIQNRLISRTYKTRDELFNSINYAKNGRYATDEEKWMVIEYMEFHKWPYSSQLMMDTLVRYIDGDITLSLPSEDLTEENEIKMNK